MDGANLARSRDMRPAARGDVVVGHLHQAQLARAPGFLPQRERRRLLVAHEPDRHGPILPHDSVGVALGGDDLLMSQLLVEVERRQLRPEVEADRARLEEPVEGRREDVLTGVLLHVVEPAPAIDGAVHGLAGGEVTPRTCRISPSSRSTTSTTGTSSRRPVSNGWPPEVG